MQDSLALHFICRVDKDKYWKAKNKETKKYIFEQKNINKVEDMALMPSSFVNMMEFAVFR